MKALIIQSLVFFILIFSVNSCSKSTKCWGKDKNKGDISESVKITCQPLSGDRWVINDQSTYEQTFDSACALPEIDFNNYTLLGLQANGGCETKYIREVDREENGNTHYKVTVKSCGMCKSLVISYNWITIRKIPGTATVTFEVKEK